MSTSARVPFWPALLAALSTLFCSAATAAPPPDMPLPACTVVNGVQQGACPWYTSDVVSGTASGRFGAGQTVTVTTVPSIPKCTRWNQGANAFTPSPCYNGIAPPAFGGCAYIDLQDGGRFKRASCPEVLYLESNASTTSQLFSLRRLVDGSPHCGVGGFFWGSSDTSEQGGETWMGVNDAWLECELTFRGPRPDGLYGPTWVAVNVGIDRVSSGCCNADPRYSQTEDMEFFIPIDGDLRESLDVSVLATAVLRGSEDNLEVTYTATISNEGTQRAENFEVAFDLPEEMHFLRVSDSRCTQSGGEPFAGGNVICRGMSLAPQGDAAGNDVHFVELVARIINAAELQRDVRIFATLQGDMDASNDSSTALVRPDLRTATVTDTRQAMEALAPYFDYQTRPELLNLQCDVYMNDIFGRLEAIRELHPSVFNNLSHGRVTSGDYRWAPIEIELTRAGHVGVVVYLKGTDYRQTGIVIHGTPTWSPADRDSQSQLGTQPMGEHTTINVWREGTADHGLYYRTPIQNFPGNPRQEAPLGCGFEGLYSTNGEEFRRQLNCAPEGPAGPFFPDAVVVRTESPVDIILTNAQGQRIETQGGAIVAQELVQSIHSFATPHEDGTYGWILVLPVDDYDVQLRGTQTGTYKLTLTTFNADGTRNDTVTEGVTTPGQVDNFTLDAPEGSGRPTTPTTPTTPTVPGGSAGRKGGGGALGAEVLLGLLLIFGLQRLRRAAIGHPPYAMPPR